MPRRDTVCRALGLCVVLGLALGLAVSASLFIGWLREPTYEESANALDLQRVLLGQRHGQLLTEYVEGRVPFEEVKRVELEMQKKDKEMEELNRHWRDRHSPRLEESRREIRRRLGW